MKKYVVYANHITYYKAEIEAANFNKASEMAECMDYDEFDEVDGDFYISGVAEKEE